MGGQQRRASQNQSGPVCELNDPFELLSIDRSNWRNRNTLRERTKTINKRLGLICFSKSGHNPVLWGHYADKHTGICMGFDVPKRELHDVIYTTRVGNAPQNPDTGRLTLTPESINRLMRTKFNDWKYEDETRLFVPLRGLRTESGKYFLPFSENLRLRELVLGARCDIEIKAIGPLAGHDVTIFKAELLNAGFKVYWIIGLPGDEVSTSLRPMRL